LIRGRPAAGEEERQQSFPQLCVQQPLAGCEPGTCGRGCAGRAIPVLRYDLEAAATDRDKIAAAVAVLAGLLDKQAGISVWGVPPEGHAQTSGGCSGKSGSIAADSA